MPPLAPPTTLFPFLRAANSSTSWPGKTSFGIWILYFAVVTGFSHFTLTLVLGVQMLQMDNYAWCQVPGSTGTGYWQDLPVSFVGFDGVTQLANLGEMQSKFSLAFHAIIMPLLTMIIIFGLLILHYSSWGVRNRDGMIGGFLIVLTTCYSMYGDTLVAPDESIEGEDKGYTKCYMEPGQVWKFVQERQERWGLLVAGEVLGGVTCLCGIIYFVFAIIATYKNRNGDVKAKADAKAKADVKLQDFDSPSEGSRSSSTEQARWVSGVPVPEMSRGSQGQGDGEGYRTWKVQGVMV